MKVTIGGNLTKEVDSDASSLSTSSMTHQYICCVLNVHGGQKSSSAETTGPKGSRRYTNIKYQQKSIRALKWVILLQIFCGCMIFGSQIGPKYWKTIANNEKVSLYGLYSMPDEIAAGIWSGFYIAVTGFIGMAAIRKNRLGLIIAHLVTNVFALLFAVAVITLAAMSIDQLRYCKTRGVGAYVRYSFSSSDYEDQTYNNSDYDDQTYSSSGYEGQAYGKLADTTTAGHTETYSLFGEDLVVHIYDGNTEVQSRFYCEAGMFTAWLGFEILMIIGSLATLGATVWLIVKNCTTLCSCCRVCCDDEVEEDVAMIKLTENALYI